MNEVVLHQVSDITKALKRLVPKSGETVGFCWTAVGHGTKRIVT